MEINAGESARAVLDYVRDLEPEHIEAMRDAQGDFERYANIFERLAETDDERLLGREVAKQYSEFRALGDQIVQLASQRRRALEVFRRNVLEIDELIDEELQIAIDTTNPVGMKKLHSALEMEINIDEAFFAIEGYVLHPDPSLRREAEDAEADFERCEALYWASGVSAEEAELLKTIDADFEEAVTVGNQIMTVTDTLNQHLEDFEDRLESLDAILDDQIQPLIRAETVKAANAARNSTNQAALYLVVLGLVGLCIAVAAAWIIYRGIILPVRTLVRGTEVVVSGDLDHRIKAGSNNEFGDLALAFNNMVANLNLALQSVVTARQQLEQKVVQRTESLKLSEERFKDFAKASSDWFWETDADLRFTFVSDRFFRRFKCCRRR